jgi:hypothetical protein
MRVNGKILLARDRLYSNITKQKLEARSEVFILLSPYVCGVPN